MADSSAFPVGTVLSASFNYNNDVFGGVNFSLSNGDNLQDSPVTLAMIARAIRDLYASAGITLGDFVGNVPQDVPLDYPTS